MKKLLALFLAAMMLLSLAACGNNKDNPSGSNTDKPGVSQSGENNSGGNTDNPGSEQKQQTADEYVAALSEYIKSRHSGAFIYYDQDYLNVGYAVFEACVQSDTDSDYCTVYTYIGYYNRDTAYEKSKTADSVGVAGNIDVDRVTVEWNDELKCYYYSLVNESWATVESRASSLTVVQERSN